MLVLSNIYKRKNSNDPSNHLNIVLVMLTIYIKYIYPI